MSNAEVVKLPGAASQGTVVEQTRAAAEVAAAVSVARQFPRDENQAREEMTRLCGSIAVAERAFYEVPNRGAGLSVHIARELARVWRNVDYGVRELNRDDTAGVSEMQAWAWDVENNVRSTRSFIQPHARMAGGKRKALTDLQDIYLMNQNTAARAVRECIFTVLPQWFKSEAETLLKGALRDGGGKSLEQRVTEAIAAFLPLGVKQAQLETRAGKPAARWTPDDLAGLRRAYSSITQDGIPVQEFFPDDVVTVAELAEDGA